MPAAQAAAMRSVSCEFLTDRMKGVPEEEEEDEDGSEVWTSLTTPPPKIPSRPEDSAPVVEDNTFWDPDYLEGIPRPPDGGWGWVIVTASFFCNMVVDGIAYSFGVFLIHFVQYYQSPKGVTAWIGSLLTGCYLTAGPLVSALTNRFGCRPVTMVGSLITTVAFLLSTAAPSVHVLMFTYGIMGGIGFGLVYLPGIVSVGYYFSTKRAFATGIAVCGSGMGAFVFAPVTQFLLDHYDWKGALIILAGMALNCMVFGALMRPLTAEPPPCKNALKTDADYSAIKSDKGDSGLVSLISEEQNVKTHLLNTEPGVQSTLNIAEETSKSKDTLALPTLLIEDVHNSVDVVPAVGVIVATESSNQPLSTKTHLSQVANRIGIQQTDENQNASLGTLRGERTPTIPPKVVKDAKVFRSQMNVKDMHRRFTLPAAMPASANVLCPTANNNYMVQRSSVATGTSFSGHGGATRRRRASEKRDLARPLYRKDIFYSGSIVNLPEFQHSRNDVRSYVASVTTIPRPETPSDVESEKKKRPWWHIKLPRSMVDTLIEILDFSLLKQPAFFLACIANIFGMMGFYIPFVYITDSSIMKGIERDPAAFLISVIGITNLIGRILFGWIVDKTKISALHVNNFCLTVSGLAIMTVPLAYSYTALVVACSIFSVFVSAFISLTSILLVEMVGLDKLTNSFGLLCLFRGFASIIGPPIAGTVYDLTGSYDIPFYMAGAMLITSAALTFFVPWVSKKSKDKCKAVPPQNNTTTFAAKDGSAVSDTDSGRPESITTPELSSPV